MTIINFDKIIDRSGTNATKVDFSEKYFGEKGLTPLWVADMDFQSPKELVEAMKLRAEHGVYGYTLHDDAYYNSIIDWNRRRNRWEVKKEWIITSLGVVTSIAFIINSLTQKGDEVLVQPPVYYPFFNTIKSLGRKIVYNPLVFDNGKYRMDYRDLEEKIGPKTKLIILCSPHNPVGRVWEEHELEKLAKICIEKGITIISDEIHSDLIYTESLHTPLAKISAEISESTITLMSPSKTFNLAGLFTSYMLIENKELRVKIQSALNTFSIHQNIFGITALKTAYSSCEYWLESLMEYIDGNRKYVENFLSDKMPEIKLVRPEGTYLLWIDFRSLRLNKNQLDELILKKAKLGLSDGGVFGKEGEGFKRMNIASPRGVIEESMKKLFSAYKETMKK